MERGRERSSIVRAVEAVEVRSRGGLEAGAGVSVEGSAEGAEVVDASRLLRGAMVRGCTCGCARCGGKG